MHAKQPTQYTAPDNKINRSYVRLEAMEGVVAFHSGDAAGAARHLAAAQDRWQKLQVGAFPAVSQPLE
jgi:hypothetical protein